MEKKKQKLPLDPEFIIKALKNNEAKLKSFGVKKIGLFGSYLRGESNARSDIDFVVEFSQPTFDSYMELKFFLEKLFRKKVDLVTVGALKPKLEHIKEEALYA